MTEVKNCISTLGKDIYFIAHPTYCTKLTWEEVKKLREAEYEQKRFERIKSQIALIFNK